MIAINLYALGVTGQAIIFKQISKNDGVKVTDFQVFRNIFILVIAFSITRAKRLGIFDIPTDLAGFVATRSVLGQTVFFLLNVCLSLIPFYILVIIF